MKKYIYISIIIALLLGSCNYLDVVPESDIQTIETIFEKKEGAEEWLKTCHIFLIRQVIGIPKGVAFTGADEIAALDYARRLDITIEGMLLADGLQNTSSPLGNVWDSSSFYAAIRYCNIFLQHIGNTYNMKKEEADLWSAEIKAIKAHYYFELMRRYGPIILVPQNIPANDPIKMMQQPRSPIDECVQAIVDLLDEAIQDLPISKEKGLDRITFHSKESASTLKAMTLLYAASPLFNGNTMMTDFKNKKGEPIFSAYDKEKWKKAAEAIDEAIRLCEAGDFQLISGYSSKPTRLLNIMKDIENTVLAPGYQNEEAILMFREEQSSQFMPKFSFPKFREDQKDIYFDRQALGAFGASIKIVEMFYTENGLPINEDKNWVADKYLLGKETDERYQNVIPLNTNTVLNLHLRREPRFYANIAADQTLWYRMQRKNWQNVEEATPVDAYQPQLFGSHYTYYNNNALQNPTGYWIKKYINSEIPFVEYHNSLSSLGEQGAVVFRLAELYLASAEAWNEYLDVPDQRVYEPLNKVRRRAGILDVQEAWSSYARNPQKVNTQIGMREIIRQEWNIEFMFEGRRFYNLRRWMTAHEELNDSQYGWNILGKNAREFYNNFEGPVEVWKKRKFLAPRDYFFPLKSEEIIISGCVQNPGW